MRKPPGARYDPTNPFGIDEGNQRSNDFQGFNEFGMPKGGNNRTNFNPFGWPWYLIVKIQDFK